jgi:hypothetical protein
MEELNDVIEIRSDDLSVCLQISAESFDEGVFTFNLAFLSGIQYRATKFNIHREKLRLFL